MKSRCSFTILWVLCYKFLMINKTLVQGTLNLHSFSGGKGIQLTLPISTHPFSKDEGKTVKVHYCSFQDRESTDVLKKPTEEGWGLGT